MTPFALQQTPQETLQVIPDSLVVVQDTAADTTGAATDTTNVFTEIARGADEAGRLLLAGEYEAFWRTVYSELGDLFVQFFSRLIPALLFLILLYVIYRMLDNVLNRVLTRSKHVDAGLQGLMQKTYRVVTLVFITVMFLGQLGFDVTALLAGLSIAGIAVGFAARDTLENFISGITILVDRPFRVSDNIQVEDVYGTVEEITLRSTRLRTLNNTIMVLPNVHMIQNKLVNHSMLGIVRVEVPFGIAYKEYPQDAREVVLKLIEGDRRLHPDYPPTVVVTALNDSSVDMALRLYISNPKLEVMVRFEYIEKVREALREADIEIPFPHLQLFVDEAKAFDDTFLMKPQLPLQPPNNQPSA